MEDEIKKLKERIEELEKRPQYVPTYQPIIIEPMRGVPMLLYGYNPNLHYHGSIPCYNNPCYWC